MFDLAYDKSKFSFHVTDSHLRHQDVGEIVYEEAFLRQNLPKQKAGDFFWKLLRIKRAK